MNIAHTAGDEPVTAAVITAIAEHEEIDPVELEPPLFEAIDVDALNELFPHGSEGTIQFLYRGHQITVSADGEVTIEDS